MKNTGAVDNAIDIARDFPGLRQEQVPSSGTSRDTWAKKGLAQRPNPGSSRDMTRRRLGYF
jgi:hypothetical protein